MSSRSHGKGAGGGGGEGGGGGRGGWSAASAASVAASRCHLCPLPQSLNVPRGQPASTGGAPASDRALAASQNCECGCAWHRAQAGAKASEVAVAARGAPSTAIGGGGSKSHCTNKNATAAAAIFVCVCGLFQISTCTMYPHQILLAILAFISLSRVTNSEDVDAALRKQLKEVANLEMVQNASEIMNWRDLVLRSAIPYMRDCDEMFQAGHRESGLYIIRPDNARKLVVQCYMDGCNGWTVIQHNTHDTEITWSETWTTYKYGFGNLEADHWLGNEYISLITQQKWYKVRIRLVDADGNHKYAEYDSFVLQNEDNGYALKLGTYEGNAGDSLSNSRLKNMHDNMKFSCKNQDNDRSTLDNCANVHGGGWWYDNCFNAQLNRKGGLHWSTLCEENCRRSVIMLKPIHMYCTRV
ncbi:fibrinogen-like protein 1-like protein [Sceloporus undulatus]|uniref:fibrinogen-like protein 1-like protein n=1 Tax=Sceloporus undulatus TaxID=8520 RepID=UPI001C4D26DD|nr:fibrinogen-like protein 1-like protein [Sceloporus undulatus]